MKFHSSTSSVEVLEQAERRQPGISTVAYTTSPSAHRGLVSKPFLPPLALIATCVLLLFRSRVFSSSAFNLVRPRSHLSNVDSLKKQHKQETTISHSPSLRAQKGLGIRTENEHDGMWRGSTLARQ